MSTKCHTFDVTVVGGGLSGLCAALRLGTCGARVLLLDTAITGPTHTLGGFAQFSGAKFSMPPAGMGILPIAGSTEALIHAIEEVLSILELDTTYHETSPDIRISLDDQELAHGVHIRKPDYTRI
jgi:phytoene dehydrogenase-like protein